MIAVAVIVLGELLSLNKTISVDQLTTLFSELAVWRVALMLLISLLCIAPMIGYDIILNRLLGQKLSARYLSETSWIINTMNNLVGFGGFISIGLRSGILWQRKNGKDVAQAISENFYLSDVWVITFVITGIRVRRLLDQQLIICSNIDLAIGRKFVLSSGLCLKFVEEEWLFRRSAPSDRGQLILVSLLEWVGVFTAFITTGMLMGISVDIFKFCHYLLLHL